MTNITNTEEFGPSVEAVMVTVEGGPFESVMQKLKDFSPEQRAILMFSLSEKISELLQVGLQNESWKTVALAANINEFVKVAMGVEGLSHPEWTSTGDRAVEDLWGEYLAAMDTVSMTRLGLPQDMIERIISGEPTDEDKTAAMEAVRKYHDAGGKVGIIDEDVEDPKAAHGTGLYL